MQIVILGADGYQGWPCAMHLAKKGHVVLGVDNFARREWVRECGGHSATPILPMSDRLSIFGEGIQFVKGSINHYELLEKILSSHEVEAIIHFAEQPSAPYAMMDLEHAKYTMRNNIDGTLNLLFAIKKHCPDVHLLRMGTMGFYGTPNRDIPEGFMADGSVFPPSPGSFYHLSKVHTFQQCLFTAKTWGLRISSFEQGVISGVNTSETKVDPGLCTRFDFDGVFGTIINRFCSQVILGEPLSVFGSGTQKRGFASLENTLRCIELVLQHPVEKGKMEVYNQFDKIYSIQELANSVQEASESIGLNSKIKHVPNPRVEAEHHYYNPANSKLKDLGFMPRKSLTLELKDILQTLIPLTDRMVKKRDHVTAKVKWQ